MSSSNLPTFFTNLNSSNDKVTTKLQSVWNKKKERIMIIRD